MYTSTTTIDRQRMINQRSSLFSIFFFFMVSMTEFNDIDLSNQTLSFIYNDTSTHGCTFCNIKRHRLLSRRRLVIKTIFIWVLVSMIYTILAISFFWLILAMMTHKCFDLFENIINIGVFFMSLTFNFTRFIHNSWTG